MMRAGLVRGEPPELQLQSLAHPCAQAGTGGCAAPVTRLADEARLAGPGSLSNPAGPRSALCPASHMKSNSDLQAEGSGFVSEMFCFESFQGAGPPALPCPASTGRRGGLRLLPAPHPRPAQGSASPHCPAVSKTSPDISHSPVKGLLHAGCVPRAAAGAGRQLPAHPWFLRRRSDHGCVPIALPHPPPAAPKQVGVMGALLLTLFFPSSLSHLARSASAPTFHSNASAHCAFPPAAGCPSVPLSLCPRV